MARFGPSLQVTELEFELRKKSVEFSKREAGEIVGRFRFHRGVTTEFRDVLPVRPASSPASSVDADRRSGYHHGSNNGLPLQSEHDGVLHL